MESNSRLLTIHLEKPVSFFPVKLTYTEALSQPFTARLTAHIDTYQFDELDALLMEPISIRIQLPHSPAKIIHGIIEGFDLHQEGDERSIVLTVIPWCKLLDYERQFRIFKEQSVIDIVKWLCKPNRYTQTLPSCFSQVYVDTQQLTGKYPPLDCCVQYNETDFHFISRLLAQAGIYYYFEHTEHKHVMTLGDNSTIAPVVNPGYSFQTQSLTEPHIFSGTEEFNKVPEGVAYHHYDEQHGSQFLNDYAKDKTSPYLSPSQANTREGMTVEARHTLQRQQQAQHQYSLESNIITAKLHTQVHLVAEPGTFSVEQPTVLITAIEHTVVDQTQAIVRELDNAPAASYHNTLTALPANKHYRPPLLEGPKAYGLHPAIVCGEDGAAQTDARGRIRVRFLWHEHRELINQGFMITQPEKPTANKTSDNPQDPDALISTWMRVAQPAAHKRSGHHWLPRAGDEVRVKFFDNDPTRPIVLGSIVKAPPFSEQDQYKTGFYTTDKNSVLNLDTAQHVVFDSTPQQEKISFNAAKDFVQTTHQDENIVVENNYHESVGGDTTITADTVYIDAEQGITLKGGDSEICITPDKLTIKTPKLDMKKAQSSAASENNPPSSHQAAHTDAQTAVNSPADQAQAQTSTEKTAEKTIKLRIYLCDRSNQSSPETQLPDIVNLIDELNVSIQYLTSTTRSTVQHYPVSNGYAEINHFNKYVNQIRITLQNTANSTDNNNFARYYGNQFIPIIAKNSQSLTEQPPSNTIFITPSDWEQFPGKNDEGGNLYYQVHLTLLEPLLLFNCRQDAWAASTGEYPDADTEDLSSYFETEELTGIVADQFPDDVLRHYQHQGNNITFFIHGFNQYPGELSAHFQAVAATQSGLYDYLGLPAEVNYVADGYKNTLFNPSDDQQNGTGAYNWLLSMEHHLNQAAGFDGKDYRQYTRLVGICWQGNPKSTLDYMAAVAMTQFAAKKLFTLIKQCHDKGIKINLMAHSLGNAVLMEVLALCNYMGVPIEHSFLWEAAIPNNSFDSETIQNNYYFPMIINERPLAYEYFYPGAEQASKAVTVLYSDKDNILGPAPIPNGYNQAEERTNIMNLVGRVLHDIVIMGAAPYVSSKESRKLTGKAYLEDFIAKADDPGVGFISAIPSLVIYLVDEPVASGLDCQSLRSIYNLANLFVVPLSYLKSQTNRESYYQRWSQHYQSFYVRETQYAFEASLEEQQQLLQTLYPEVYAVFNQLMIQLEALSEAGPESSSLNNHIQGMLFKVFNEVGNSIGIDGFGEFYVAWYEVCTGKSLVGAAYDTVHDAIHDILNDYIYSALKQDLSHIESFVTMTLSVLLTKTASPADAMGYKGATVQTQDLMAGKYFGTAQQDPSGKDLCIDHCAMHYPSDEMMKWVFKRQLMETDGLGFKYFGKWKS